VNDPLVTGGYKAILHLTRGIGAEEEEEEEEVVELRTISYVEITSNCTAFILPSIHP